jgi:DNA-directed RNA polymerase specialized sigma24 family protein
MKLTFTRVRRSAKSHYILERRNSGYKGSVFMESPTRSPFLDQFGNPLPDHIQRALDDLSARFRRKFPTIRDEVEAVEILERAGQQVMAHESKKGTASSLHGLAWVAIRNCAISKLRSGPHRLEQATTVLEESAADVARLAAVDGGPERVENRVLLRQVLDQFTMRERKIAIWKHSDYSSRSIAEALGMTAASVDTAYFRLRVKARRILGRPLGANELGRFRAAEMCADRQNENTPSDGTQEARS